MSNDRYENIRKALAMGPTPGPWSEYANRQWRPYIAGADGSLIAFIESDDDVEDADAAHIAACDPDTIRALLDERDALREALKELIAWVPSADTYRRLGFDPEAPMRALGAARAALRDQGEG